MPVKKQVNNARIVVSSLAVHGCVMNGRSYLLGLVAAQASNCLHLDDNNANFICVQPHYYRVVGGAFLSLR